MEKASRQTVIADVRGADLPAAWAERAGLAPEDRVDVVIRPTRAEFVARLMEVAGRISARAANQGLTEEKLQELLRDD